MNRAVFLALLLGITLSTIFMLPPFQQVDSAMAMEIPDEIGVWRTKPYPVSQKELDILAGDTEFSKAACGVPRYSEMSYITGRAPTDVADLSIVMSGHDIANSIHRPERCMPAQGHRGLQGSSSTLELANGKTIPVRRILSRFDPGSGEEATAVTYYFFVGETRITEDHLKRTLIDTRDRLFKGRAQRWAYVSVTMPYLDQPDPPRGAPLTLEAADKKIRELLVELADRNINWEQIRG